jgi:hypothetical protein
MIRNEHPHDGVLVPLPYELMLEDVSAVACHRHLRGFGDHICRMLLSTVHIELGRVEWVAWTKPHIGIQSGAVQAD